MQFGYEHSPLEQMAYALQEAFDHQKAPNGIVDIIRTKSDEIWASVAGHHILVQ